MRRQVTGLALAIAAAAGMPAAAQTFSWAAPVSGLWHVGGNWSPVGIPNSGLADAFISTPGIYTVSLNANTTLGSLTLGSGAGVLDINNGTVISIGANGVFNDTSITINSAAGPNATSMALTTGSTLGGGGTTVLNASSNLDTAYLFAVNNGSFTHAAGHTIRGSGNIYYDVTNNGSIIADQPGRILNLTSGQKINDGTMAAINGATLRVSSGEVVQPDDRSVTANASTISLVSGIITGGSVLATNGSSIVVDGNSALNETTTVSGPVFVNNSATLRVGTGIVHGGTITINPTAGPNATDMVLTAGATLGGGGTAVLNASSNLDTARLYALNGGAAASFTHAAGHTIRGSGNIYYDVTNNGSIIADQPGRTLVLLGGTITNNAVIEATNSAVLSFSNETINGGLLRASGGGRIVHTGGALTLNNVSLAGPFDINNGTTLSVGTGLTNDGTITVNPTAGPNATNMVLTTGSTLAGSGTTVLNANPGNLSTAQLYALNGGAAASFTHAAGHTIRGSGFIYYGMTNNGSIIADQNGRTLDLTSGQKVNAGTMAAINGATLRVSSGEVVQPDDRSVTANASTISLVSGTITGGSVLATNGSSIVVDGDSSLNATTSVSGPVFVNNSATLRVGTGIVHDGTITVNPTGGPNATNMILTGGSTLGGSGTTVLNANPGNLSTAQLYALNGGAAASFIHAAGHTIRGSGFIYYGMTNNGSIIADQPGRTLVLTTGTITNNAVIEATNSAVLSFSNETISGGLLRASGGGRIVHIGGTLTLNNVSLAGPFDINNGTTLSVGTGLTNDGTITVNPTAGPNATNIVLTTGSTLGGTGTTVLNASSNLDTAYLFAANNGTFTHAAGHTIRGSGNIYYGFTNNGTLSPGKPSANAPLNFEAGSLVNTSTAVTNIRMGISGPLACDTIGGGSSKVLAGTLNVEFAPGFMPPRCATYTIITGSNISGTFSVANLPLPEKGFLSLIYSPTSVRIANVPADFNGDGFIDFFDYDDYVECFETGSCLPGRSADFNNDGFVDFFDYDDFVGEFESGC